MGAAQTAQSEALANLLKTGDYSDLTITCGKYQYRVHKAIICPRSNFFKAACDGKFKEAQTGKVDLPDDDPAAVRMMIEYLYHDTYVPAEAIIHRDHVSGLDAHLSETEYNEQEKRKMELYGATFIGNKRVKRLTALPEAPIAPISQPVPVGFGTASTPPPPPPAAAPPRPILTQNLHLHAKVYALGEKYGIQPLKVLALRKFAAEAPFRLHTDDFLKAIREAYTSTIETDRPLRDAVVTILRSNKHLLNKDSVKEVLKDPGLGLSFDMVMGFASD
ncbi:amino acid transport gap1 [Fusarium denticulatum]|uniref:Amino acid transport gap1 n=1 Tax=Fusarium denticulatum TaxID=48507 RepID=A0A8H5UL98_9HYPO|nr:amino acid transport gap1 [Fusarium denticulatum]